MSVLLVGLAHCLALANQYLPEIFGLITHGASPSMMPIVQSAHVLNHSPSLLAVTKQAKTPDLCSNDQVLMVSL